MNMNKVQPCTSVLFSSAWVSVKTSANSNSLPFGMPVAILVTRTFSSDSNFAMYIAVMSPLKFGFVAIMTS